VTFLLLHRLLLVDPALAELAGKSLFVAEPDAMGKNAVP
jgi:hypothetical protein